MQKLLLTYPKNPQCNTRNYPFARRRSMSSGQDPRFRREESGQWWNPTIQDRRSHRRAYIPVRMDHQDTGDIF